MGGKNMKKHLKTLFIVALSMGITASGITTNYKSAFAAEQTTFQNSRGYVQGAYKESAIHPSGQNWNRVSPFIGGDTPVISWILPIGAGESNDQIHTLPAIDEDGTIYSVSTSSKKLYAIDPNGLSKWDAQLDGYPVGAPVIGIDGTIYATSYDSNKVYAFAPTGKLKWKYELSDKVKGSVALSYDGTVYVAGEDRKLHALTATGQEIWYLSLDGKVQGTPVVAEDGTIYVGTLSGSLYAVNNDGSIRWTINVPGEISFSTPTIGIDGAIHVGHTNYLLSAITQSGENKWAINTGQYIEYSSPAVTKNGYVYITGAGNLYSFDQNGMEAWKANTPGMITHNGVIIDKRGVIYATTMEGSLIAYNSNDGSIRWQIGVSKDKLSAPILSNDGTIFVLDSTGKLIAVNTHGEVKSENKDVPRVENLEANVTQTTVELRWYAKGNPDHVTVTGLGYHEQLGTTKTNETSYTYRGLQKYRNYTFEVVPYKNGVAGIPAYLTLFTQDPNELASTPDIYYADYVDNSNRSLLVKVKSATKENFIIVKDKSQSFKVVQRVPVVNGMATIYFDKEGTYDISAEAISDNTGNSYFSPSFWLAVEFAKTSTTTTSNNDNNISEKSTSADFRVTVRENTTDYVITTSLPTPLNGERIVYKYYNENGQMVGSISGKIENGYSVSTFIKGKQFLPSGKYTVKANYVKGKTVKVVETNFTIDAADPELDVDVEVLEDKNNYVIHASLPFPATGEKIDFRYYNSSGKLIGSTSSKVVDGMVISTLKKPKKSLPFGKYKVIATYSSVNKVSKVIESSFSI